MTKLEITCRVYSSKSQKKENIKSIKYYTYFMGKKMWLKDVHEAMSFKKMGAEVHRTIFMDSII